MSVKRVALYLRVSKDESTIENQRRELLAAAKRHKWNVTDVFKDEGISGAKGKDDRRGFRLLHEAIARKKVDLVAAWSVDRVGRSLSDLIAFLRELQAKGIDLYLHVQGVDTSTPAGRAMFQMLGVFAEFELAMTRARIKTGLARARAAGAIVGRPRTAADKEAKVTELLRAGTGIRSAARQGGVATSVAQRLYKTLPARSKKRRTPR